MEGQVYVDEEGNLFTSIPNNADGDCLFESLAYFEVGDKTKEGICKKSTELRNQLCDAYKEILYDLYDNIDKKNKIEINEILTRKKKKEYKNEWIPKWKQKYSYAYKVINEYHNLIGKKQKNLDDLEKEILKTLFDGKVLHVDNVCNRKQWGSDMDILVLSALLKKHIRMYRIADNSRLLDPTDFPSADFFEEISNLKPKDFIDWPTVRILFRNINNDTNKDGNHFEALVKVTTDNIVEERHNEALIERLVNENYINNINDSFNNADIDPNVISNIRDDLVDKHKKEQEIKSAVVVDHSNFVKLQKKADAKTKEEKETKKKTKKKTNEKEDTKKKKKANKTQKKSSSSLKDKQVKTAPPKEKTNTTLKKEEVKTASPKEEEITKILNDLLPKETTPKNNTRKKSPQTVVNVSPKEREKLAIEMTLQDNYLEKPKVIVVEPSIKKNDIVKIKYNNGDVYIGEVKNNKKHGKGKYIFANGQTYTGEYRNGKRI